MDEEPNPTLNAIGPQTIQLGLAAVLPVVAALALAAADVLQSSGRQLLPCPLYPNAVVAFAAKLHESCPLEPGDEILGIRSAGRTEAVGSARDLYDRISRGGTVEVAIHGADASERMERIQPISRPAMDAWTYLGSSMLLASLLLAFVMLTAVRSGVPAAAPFAVIHSSIGVLIVAAVAGWTSTRSYPLTALARAALPAAVCHLAFVFPRPREVAIRVPGVRLAPYWIAGAIFGLELIATYWGSASTMLLLQRILVVAVATAFLLLCLSSWLSLQESPSQLARGQARSFLTGLSLVVVGTLVGSMLQVPGGPLTAVTFGAALAPIPLGYAIAQFHLFAFDTKVRTAVSQIVYLSIWSGLFFLGVIWLRDRLPLPDLLRHPVVMYAGVYAVLAPLDRLRQLLKRSIERAFQPKSRTWAQLSEGRASQIAQLRDPDGIARAAVALAADGVPNAGISLFLGDRSKLRLACALGRDGCGDAGGADLGHGVVTA